METDYDVILCSGQQGEAQGTCASEEPVGEAVCLLRKSNPVASKAEATKKRARAQATRQVSFLLPVLCMN